MPQDDVVVGIPTYRRPEWLDELLSLLDSRQQHGEDLTTSVLVVDNDPEASAASVLARHPRVLGKHAPEGGLASVRNQILTSALAGDFRWLALVDDDEMPEPHWVRELLRVAREYRADVVTGSLTVERPQDLTRLGRVVRQRPVHPEGLYTGDILTGNCLVDLDVVRRTGARFDDRFDFSGGEDTHFFRRLARHGAVFGYAPGARVVERQDPSRFTDRDLLRRVFRSGQSSVRIEAALGEGKTWAHRALSLLAVTARTGVVAPWLAARRRPEEALGHVLKVLRHLGRVAPARASSSRYS